MSRCQAMQIIRIKLQQLCKGKRYTMCNVIGYKVHPGALCDSDKLRTSIMKTEWTREAAI